MPRLCKYSTNRSLGERATGTLPSDDSSPMAGTKNDELVETADMPTMPNHGESAGVGRSLSINKIVTRPAGTARRESALLGRGGTAARDELLPRANSPL